MRRIAGEILARVLKVKVPLTISIEKDSVEDVKLAIRLGDSMDYIQMYNGGFVYPLMTSVLCGNETMCSVMLEKGDADPNYVFEYLESKKKVGSVDIPQLLTYHDPELRISKQMVPSSPNITSLSQPEDLRGWKKITPTVLAFILGNDDILNHCLRKGGRLSHHFSFEEESFLEYFLCHPKTCTPKVCRLLIMYREFFINTNEQYAFNEFLCRFEIMKQRIMLPYSLVHLIETILQMLTKYGYRKDDQHEINEDEVMIFQEVKTPHAINRRFSFQFKNEKNQNNSNGQLSSNPSPERIQRRSSFISRVRISSSSSSSSSSRSIISNKENKEEEKEKCEDQGRRRRSFSNPLKVSANDLLIQSSSVVTKSSTSQRVSSLDGKGFDHRTSKILFHNNASMSDNENNEYYISKTKELWLKHHHQNNQNNQNVPNIPNNFQLQQQNLQRRLSILTQSISSDDVIGGTTSGCESNSSFRNLRKMIYGGTLTPARFKKPSSFRRKNADLVKDEKIVKRSISRRRKKSHVMKPNKRGFF